MSSFLSSNIAPSSSASNARTSIDLPINFWDFMNHNKQTGDNTSRKRKSSGVQEYTCKICPLWGPSVLKWNAIQHCLRTHPLGASQLSQLRLNDPNLSISQHLLPSVVSLHRTFDRDAYKDGCHFLVLSGQRCRLYF